MQKHQTFHLSKNSSHAKIITRNPDDIKDTWQTLWPEFWGNQDPQTRWMKTCYGGYSALQIQGKKESENACIS